MIDVERDIFQEVSTVLHAAYTDIYVTGEYVPAPASFPAVSIMEMDNATYRRSQSSNDAETHASVMYEINVYSNKAVGKKSEAKAIMLLADQKMTALGFTRMSVSTVPNMADATIYRIVGRYKAVVRNDNTLFRQ